MAARVARLESIASLVDAALAAVANVNGDISNPCAASSKTPWQASGTLCAIRHLARSEVDAVERKTTHMASPSTQPSSSSEHTLAATPLPRDEKLPEPPATSRPKLNRSPRSSRTNLRTTISAVQANRPLRGKRLTFVNRNTLNNFCGIGMKYFKEHWSATVIDGVHHSTSVDSLLKGVPSLAALLADVEKHLDISSKSVVAISLAPAGASIAYADACIVNLGGNFARIMPSSEGSASDALIFHLGPAVEGKRSKASAAAAA